MPPKKPKTAKKRGKSAKVARLKKSVKSAKKQKRPDHLFKPGESGNPNGRPPGSKNNKTRFIEQKLAELGYDPINAMVEMRGDLGNKIEDLKIKHSIDRELANYVFPKRKATEFTDTTDSRPVKELSNAELNALIQKS